MKWGLQHVKVTLEESESGETVVIEQSSDGRVTCERGKGQHERAANTPPQRAAAPAAETPTEPPARPRRSGARHKAEPRTKTERKRNDEKATKAKAETQPRAEIDREVKSKSDAQNPRTNSEAPARKEPRKSLEWEPCVDHDYHGFAAPSGAGRFKVLITKGSQWALFYELKGTWPHNLGCFRKVKHGEKLAQELHDAGWPETEFGPVTAGQIARACPAPRGMGNEETEEAEAIKTPKFTKAEEKPARKTRPKTEEKPIAEESEEKPVAEEPEKKRPAPKPEEKPPALKPEPNARSKTEPSKDNELIGGFTSELETMLDEDEDDD